MVRAVRRSFSAAMLTGSRSRRRKPPQDTRRGQKFPAEEGWKPLFNGKDLSGWTFRNPRAKKVWVVCDQVRLDPADSARLVAGRQRWVRRFRLALRRRWPRFRHHDARNISVTTSSISSLPFRREATREFTTGGSSRFRSSTASASRSSAGTTAAHSTSGPFPAKTWRSRPASGNRTTSR